MDEIKAKLKILNEEISNLDFVENKDVYMNCLQLVLTKIADLKQVVLKEKQRKRRNEQ